MRLALIGRSSAPAWLSGSLIVLFAAAACTVSLLLLRRGYKLRS